MTARKLVSLFSGAGGLDVGFSQAGDFESVVANDILTPPAESFSSYFGSKITTVEKANLTEGTESLYILGDVTEIDFDRQRFKRAEVVVGGPPCQDFSVVRGPQAERRGLDVRRGRLYAQFVRALIHINPKAFVFENVPGLKSANGGTAYSTILDDFSSLNVRWDEIKQVAGNGSKTKPHSYELVFKGVVDATAVGVPQRRRRIVVVGARDDMADWTAFNNLRGLADSVLLGAKSPLRKYPLTVIEAFEGRTLLDLADEYEDVIEEYKGVADEAGSLRAVWWRDNVWSKVTADIEKDYLTANGIRDSDKKEIDAAMRAHESVLKELGYYKSPLGGASFKDGSNEIGRESEEVIERMKMIPPDENHQFVRGTRWEVEGKGMSLIYRRVHPLKPSYTVVAKGGGGTWGYHYRRSRARLTNRERARLQTFPDDFLFRGSTQEVRSQIGEAVPPLLGKRIAQVVAAVLEKGEAERLWNRLEHAVA